MTETTETLQDRLLDAILPHVAFDGWSDTALRAAAADLEISMEEVRAVCPRGAVDLAVAYHRHGDARMLAALADRDMSELRFRDRVAEALWYRVEALADREAVRRASALFALPVHAPDGAKLVWETADHIWTALGDTSDDLNWYTKRATLSAVWGAVVLFWLGDDSPGHTETRAFIDRRIDDVMQIEKVKAKVRENPLTRPFTKLQEKLTGSIKAPDPRRFSDLPGHMSDQK